MACVGKDDDLRAVVLGTERRAGGMSRARSSSIKRFRRPVNAANWRPKAVAKGVGYVDAPVSGGQAGPTTASLRSCAARSGRHFTAAEPVVAAYSKATLHFGPVGRGPSR